MLTCCGQRASRKSAANTAQPGETIFVSPVTGYARNEAGNRPQQRWGVYLGMVGHKTVLDSIRATIQARQPKRQRQKLFLQGRPVFPLPTHYSQTWQHLPDYGAYHAALIADPALPGEWQPGEDVVYLLVFEEEGETPEEKATEILTARLSETLPIPVLDDWNRQLWEAARRKDLVVDLHTCGDCREGYVVQLSEMTWKEVVIGLMNERKIGISV